MQFSHYKTELVKYFLFLLLKCIVLKLPEHPAVLTVPSQQIPGVQRSVPSFVSGPTAEENEYTVSINTIYNNMKPAMT